ncbi:hypothetical protein KR084_001208 [Drosophila pseudotakahashii]|nr:hypothetical protein KR084_001208 [Drosophila pseudotakahashii]
MESLGLGSRRNNGSNSTTAAPTTGQGGVVGGGGVAGKVLVHTKLKQQQQQHSNQNYYTQQQTQLQRLKQQQQKLQQQQQQQLEAVQGGVAKHCLQFPPPPDYPPPTGGGSPGNTPGRRQQLPRYPDPDPDAIEICNESATLETSPHHLKQLAARHSKSLGRNLGHQQHHHHAVHLHHDYSYAYYEPGAAMRHSNVPGAVSSAGGGADGGAGVSSVVDTGSSSSSSSTEPPPNSIRALLSKGKKNKQLVSPATLQSYQTRYHKLATKVGQGQSENFYEEINAAALQTNSGGHQLRSTVGSHSAGSLNQTLVEEELRRVQNRHHKILGELNLSVEAMLMPESPPKSMEQPAGGGTGGSGGSGSGSAAGSDIVPPQPSVSVTAASGQPPTILARLTSASADNICDSGVGESSGGPGKRSKGGAPAGVVEQLLTTTCGDLDSGFSGSSGASYIGSLRLSKTQHIKCARQTPAVVGTQSCRSFQRAATVYDEAGMMSGGHNSGSGSGSGSGSSFLTRASCGRRILSCARIRAAEDPGPNHRNGIQTVQSTATIATESKARSFWSRKGWRKLPGFSTSTSSINDTGLSDEHKLNSGSWEDTLDEQHHHQAHHSHHHQHLSHHHQQHHHQQHHHSHLSQRLHHQQQQTSFIGSPTSSASITTAQLHSAFSRRIAEQRERDQRDQRDQITIAGGSFSANGGQAAVGVVGVGSSSSERDTKSPCRDRDRNLLEGAKNQEEQEQEQEEQGVGSQQQLQQQQQEEDVLTEEEQTSSSVSSLSAGNQRNSQLRSTFNKAKQHLSFDKWRTAATGSATGSASGPGSSSTSTSTENNNAASNMIMRRASACTMPSTGGGGGGSGSGSGGGSSAQREEATTPGESPGGRLSRWFSIRRGSSHQYDVGGRDGRHSTASSFDTPDSGSGNSPGQGKNSSSPAIGGAGGVGGVPQGAALDAASPQKLANLGASKMMPGVPESEDDEATANRFDMDLMMTPGSRANGTARTAHNRLIVPMLPPAPAGLSQQQLKRRHIVAAIVHSENSYVATLQRLVNDYKKPLEECSPPVLNPVKIATLFHCLPDILHSHKLFRISLAECVRNWDRDEKIGDCFVSAFGKPQLLEIYSGFINNFSAAMELAKMEEKRKSALADFFKVKQISAHDRLSFFGLMVKPVQRFPQFILFLQDLLKYTPQGHHDRMSLQLALSQLELLAELLNESKREAEQYQAFKEMLGHISGTFNARSLSLSSMSVSDSAGGHRPRYLLREDNVTHMEFNQAGFIVKCKQRRLLLLNDKVICVSVAPKQSHDFGATEKLTFKWMFPVNDVEIVDNSTSATLSRILTAGLNRGGSLKSNGSSGANGSPYANSTLPGHGGAGGFSGFGDPHSSPAAQLTNGADNLCSEMSTLMYDYEVISRIQDLVCSLKGSYKELNANTTRNVLNLIQGSIQRKDEEMAWVDSCCLQLTGRHKSGKEETFTFQTQTPAVKKEWITELRLAQLALDPNNSPAWERGGSHPQPAHHHHHHHPSQHPHTHAGAGDPRQTQEQLQLQEAVQQKQSRKMPLFVKAMPVYKSQHQTEVRCGCYYSIANDTKQSGNARRRHKQLNYLWMCSSDGTSSHITVLAQHPQQAGNLREAGAFDLFEAQVSAMEFVKGLDQLRTRDEPASLLGDLVWLGTDSRKILVYSARNPEQEEQLGSYAVPGAVQRILYHFDAVYVALSGATVLIFRRGNDGVWQLRDPQTIRLGDSDLVVPSLLPINMCIYASCANRVYVLNALNGEIQRSFEVQHGASQQVNLMAHSGIGLWISLKNSTMLCLYHTETFKHLQDINIASSVLRHDGKKEQPLNNSSVYVTALMACKGLLWVGTNVGIAVTIPLPRLEGVPIISGGINMSCHAHFGPITFLLPLIPKVYPAYKPPPVGGGGGGGGGAVGLAPLVPSMGDDLQLPAIDADPKCVQELDDGAVVLRRDLVKPEEVVPASNPSSPRSSKLDKQNSLDQSFTAKIRASLANSPAFHRKRFRDDPNRMSKTLPRGLGATAAGGGGATAAAGGSGTGTGTTSGNSSQHGEHGICDVYGLYGKLIYVKEDYDAEEGNQGNLMDMMYEGMRRSDPELAAIPGKVCTLDRRLRMKASRPRSLDLSNWSVDSKSSSLYTSSGSEESMGIRHFGGRSVSRNSSSASHKTSGTGSDLGNISENGLMTTADIHHHQQQQQQLNSSAKPEEMSRLGAGTQPAAAAVATLKRKQKQNTKQQQQQSADGPRTVITLMGGRGYWRQMWYNGASGSPSHKNSSGSGGGGGASSGGGFSGQTVGQSGNPSCSPLTVNSNDAHIVVWEKKL